MGLKSRWLAFLLPVLFLGVLLGYAFHRDPHFWRSPTSLYRSAQDAEKRGEIPLALRMAQKSFARDPKNSGCGTLLGWLYLRGSEPQKALEVLTQVWERDQKATAALKGQAQALDLLGRRPEALELLSKYLAGQPEDADISLFAAQLAGSRQEDWELAVKYYKQYCRLKPDPAARRHLVDLLAALNRFQEAIPYQEEEAAQRPEDQEALHRLALFHYWQRDYEGACELYQRLLERAQEDAVLRQEAAQAADAAKKVDEALKHYLWLYARHQGKREHALKLARLWSQKGNHAEAVAVLAPLVKEHPDPEIQRWLALESLLTGDLDKARQAYRAAWEAGDTHQETIINLARLYARQRQFSRAAAMWDEAERRQLVRAELRWEAALTYSYAQRFADAVSILEPVRRDNPKYPRLQLFLGQMHFYQKHWGQAAHYFKTYLEQHPDDPEAGRLLAEALAFKAETRDEAINAYGELLKRRNDVHLRLRRVALLLEEQRWKEADGELKACPPAQEPKLLREQARLCLWAGNLEDALARYEDYLELEPRDGKARLERARVLIYAGRAAEALEILKTLPGTAEPAPGQPGQRAVLAAGIEAALAQKDWPQALAWALRLYGCQFPGKTRPLRDWQEARRWDRDGQPASDTEETGGWLRLISARSAEDRKETQELTLEERTWVARALCHAEDPELSNLAVDLAVENLREDRHHHATLLILAHLLPRLPNYEDLSRLVYRIPGIRPDSPEYVAALAYFDGNLGRHGGKLDYLLHVLKTYRHQQPPRNPGELLALANLATELDDRQAAAEYYRLAQQIKPNDRRLAGLNLDSQLARKDWGKALASLERGSNPQNSLQKARLYMVRGQYEGVKATVAQIPPDHPDSSHSLLLLAQAYRLERNYPEALKILEQLQGRLPTENLAMARA